MQWESCLACSSLHFGYLVPKSVEWLFSLSLGQLACMPGHSITICARSIKSICAIHVCAHHDAKCDVTTYNANHVIMMSSAFTFHWCHGGMMWHYIIWHLHCFNTSSSCFASTPHLHALLHISMM